MLGYCLPGAEVCPALPAWREGSVSQLRVRSARGKWKEGSAGRAERVDSGGKSECVLPSVSRGSVPFSQPGARVRSASEG